MKQTDADVFDVVIIGGGPAGAIAGITLARRGRRVVVLEKAAFPRFHIGESFLPVTFNLLKELGLMEAIRQVPHVPKFGADFQMGYGGKCLEIDFKDGFMAGDGGYEAFNIERSVFDAVLLSEAAKAGVEVRNGMVKEILQLADGDVRVMTDNGEVRGRILLDASGQQTVVGRHLGTRKTVTESHLRKVAYFNHFRNVKRPEGIRQGHPLIAMMEEGWFWMIPLNKEVTSVGMVLDAEAGRTLMARTGLGAEKLLAWGIDHCPVVAARMSEAVRPGTNQVLADFSYHCRPYAGAGYFLIGDAAAFMDPIFSTGVSVAVQGASMAARLVDEVLGGKVTAEGARKRYVSQMEEATGTLFTLIRQYYDHSFRELFIHGRGPLAMHKAVIGVLAGNVFPRPPWKLRWRLWIFDKLVGLNRKRRLVARRRRFVLLKALAAEANQEVVKA